MAQPASDGDAPVYFQSKVLEYDDQKEIVTATGLVEIEQAGKVVRADVVQYNIPQDVVIARGNVVMVDVNGDVHFANVVQLRDEMKEGVVEKLYSELNDGSRFWAESGEQKPDKIVMRKARYTACEPCESDPDAAPIWQLKADTIVHDEEDSRVSYRDATFEIGGVPVLYTPYFSHPDGSVDRKSGFLTPSYGFSSSLGANITSEYYWDIAPNTDATFGTTLYSLEGPLFTGELRHRWRNAYAQINSSIAHAERVDRINGVDTPVDAEFRGHLFAETLWDINREWRAGADIKYTSDDQYLRQFDIEGRRDILENDIYAERFSGRNYAVGRVLSFQDLRVEDELIQRDQPNVIPEMYASFYGAPGDLFGGRWGVSGSFLGLRREGEEQDVNRLSTEAEWERRFISGFGMVSTINTSLRSDLYSVRDRDIATFGSGRSTSATEARLFPQLHNVNTYPVAKQLDNGQIMIEPTLAFTLGSSLNRDEDVPNEDSQDVQIDASNLFNNSRFPGYDAIEDSNRVTYGLRTGYYRGNGDYMDIFLGQSYRLDTDNPFPQGSGLEDQSSDVVGQISSFIQGNFALNYRFQLDNDNLQSQRHEFDNYYIFDDGHLNARYLYARGLEGTDTEEIETSREQLSLSGRYEITDSWSVRSGMRYDLGEDEGLRAALFGIDYLAQCYSFSLTGRRKFTTESSGEEDTVITFRIGLRNLGSFGTQDSDTINWEEN